MSTFQGPGNSEGMQVTRHRDNCEYERPFMNAWDWGLA